MAAEAADAVRVPRPQNARAYIRFGGPRSPTGPQRTIADYLADSPVGRDQVISDAAKVRDAEITMPPYGRHTDGSPD
jgi:hypothetical protein